MLVEFTNKGLYVPQADVYIDPSRKVDRAIITHGHADHSRYGHKSYLASKSAVPVIKHRLGSHIHISGLPYGECININGVNFSFHPAGHIIGSAQVRIEYRGEIWVVSGDYKIEDDGVAEPFEPVKCHTFITESTFGKPEFKWQPQEEIFTDMNAWWRENAATGRVSAISAYALGKAQRIIQNIDTSIGKIFTHGAVENVNEVIRRQGIDLHETHRIKQTTKPSELEGALVLAPESMLRSNWSKRLKDFTMANASGWMLKPTKKKARRYDKGFVLSDHADFEGLCYAIKESEAENIFVTHGYEEEFTDYLKTQGYNAKVAR